MSYPRNPFPPRHMAETLRDIDAQLTYNARLLRANNSPKQAAEIVRENDALLERRYRLHPVVHRCLSEENWSILKVLEEGG